MTSNNSSTSSLLSERYASALYEIATDKQCIEQVLKDLDQLVDYYKNNKNFSLLLENPLISSKDKKEIIIKIFKENKVNDLLYNFIKIIAQNKRFNFLINIIDRLNKINIEKRGDILADIISAEELNVKHKQNIQKKLRSFLGDKLNINYKIDASIIGGLIIKIGSNMIDSSLQTKINKLKLAIRGT